jgi:hypothetical protein
VGPKLIFDEIAAPVLKIIDGSLYVVWDRGSIFG